MFLEMVGSDVLQNEFSGISLGIFKLDCLKQFFDTLYHGCIPDINFTDRSMIFQSEDLVEGLTVQDNLLSLNFSLHIDFFFIIHNLSEDLGVVVKL